MLVSERLCVQNSRIQDGANILINSEDSANYSLTASLDLIGLDTADNMLMKAIKNAFQIKTPKSLIATLSCLYLTCLLLRATS